MPPANWTVFGASVALALLLGASAQAQSPATWVAVAANETGSSGLASGRSSRDLARSAALSACGRADCRVEVAIQARCVAFAESTAPRSFGYSYGADAKTVEAAALRNCRSAGGGNACKPHKTQCAP